MRQHPKAADLTALLAKLCDAGVEFIVVGGAAAVLHGAPISTNDLDIVHRRTPENVARLLELMLQLDGHALRLRSSRPSLVEGKGYDDFLSHSQPMVTEHDRTLQVLDLPTLIEVKTKAGRPKDRVVLPILIATLQERSAQK